MKITVRPLRSRLIVKPVEPEKKTASGILLSDGAAKDKAGELADVLAVGVDVEGVKVDDRIIYEKYTGNQFHHDDMDLLILSEEDVLAVVKQ